MPIDQVNAAEPRANDGQRRGMPSECDLVMKGGVASAVIYPRVMTELARKYRHFRCIGGTSAGAIAAGLTAAASYRRRTDAQHPEAGFQMLETMPSLFSRPGMLYDMFRPQPFARPIFERIFGKPAQAETPSSHGARKLWNMVTFPLMHRPELGLVAGLGLAALFLLSFAWPGFLWVGAAVSLLLAAVGYWFCTETRKIADFAQALPENFFAASSAYDAESPVSTENGPLTNWLTATINAIAGKPLAEQGPLTFGDLWLAEDGLQPGPERDAALRRCLTDPSARKIHLQTITTNLSHGRPYSLPFRDNPMDHPDVQNQSRAQRDAASADPEAVRFYFDPDEWSRLFPKVVVDWMVNHARRSRATATSASESVRAFHGNKELMRLPCSHDLPVVVGIRMSLSFPLLLGAVPLYAVDYSSGRSGRDENGAEPKDDRGRPIRRAERCWFSDGGICSNFPIHLFDSPLTRRPTFGVNLEPFPVEILDRISRPGWEHDPKVKAAEVAPIRGTDAAQPRLVGETWDRFDDEPEPLGKLLGFLGAVLNSSQGWQDNTLARQPGYRDRVVHVRQAPSEGGMNLNMPGETIVRLGERGALAGRKLRDECDIDWWDNHRFVRYHSTMGQLESFFDQIQAGLEDPDGATPEEARAFLMHVLEDDQNPLLKRFSENERKYARLITGALRTLCVTWSEARCQCVESGARDVASVPLAETSLGENAPRPRPVLRIGPNW